MSVGCQSVINPKLDMPSLLLILLRFLFVPSLQNCTIVAAHLVGDSR